jgi:DNA segregation ATPase FtsK/SpoIIIE-like protein
MVDENDELARQEFDALYDQALTFVLGCKYPTCSRLQLHLRRGYSITKKLIARMEENGIDHRIGKHAIPDPLKIKIVFVDNVGRQSIEVLMAKEIPGIEFIVINTKDEIIDSIS